MVESLIKDWDGENVIFRHDKQSGAWIIIAIHSTRLGPATGGTRMKSYRSLDEALRDALRLSAGMTYKFAVPDLPYGGGKAVIAVPPNLGSGDRKSLLRRYGALVKQLGGLFSTGPDVGTSSEDMDIIAETGAPYIFARTSSGGGAGSPGPYTALGVFEGIRVACEKLFAESGLNGRKILIQGMGSVGEALAEFLSEAGGEISFSDIDEAAIARLKGKRGYEFIPASEVYSSECDIFSPCALGGILNTETIPQLKCRAVVGAANNQLGEPGDAESLRERKILYAPDFVTNIGGAMAIMGLELDGWTNEKARENVRNAVRFALGKVFDLSAMEDITTDSAARRIAEEHMAGNRDS